MVYLSYEVGCRNCLQGDGVRRMYSVAEAKESDYWNKTEHEIAKRLETWRSEDNHSCQFCGSKNVEVLDVRADDYPLYEFSRLVRECIEKGELSFMFNIDKQGLQLRSTPGGNKQMDRKFASKSITIIVNYLDQLPDSNFKSHTNGNFFFAITGKLGSFLKKDDLKIQRFRSAGLAKSDLITSLKTFALENNIKLLS